MPLLWALQLEKEHMGRRSRTWSASKMHISSLLGTVLPGGYSWATQLFRLPDLPFISPTGRLRPDTYCTSGLRLSTLHSTQQWRPHMKLSVAVVSFECSCSIFQGKAQAGTHAATVTADTSCLQC